MIHSAFILYILKQLPANKKHDEISYPPSFQDVLECGARTFKTYSILDSDYEEIQQNAHISKQNHTVNP